MAAWFGWVVPLISVRLLGAVGRIVSRAVRNRNIVAIGALFT